MGFSEEMLAQFLRDTLNSSAWNAISEHSKLTLATFSAASGAILQAFGPEWAERHVGRSDRAADYFKANRDDLKELVRFMMRATELGELIYNLHDVPGFRERIDSIRADDKNGVESGIAELIAGRFFRLAGVRFRYITAKPENGKNPTSPDIEYEPRPNHTELCEVKCNLQSTDLNERSIFNILEKARRQLPKDKAGLILLRVPENWLVDREKGQTVIGAAIDGFIRRKKSERFSSIYLFASETIVSVEQTARVLRVKEFPNIHCTWHSGIRASRLEQGAANWRNLEDVAKRELMVMRQE